MLDVCNVLQPQDHMCLFWKELLYQLGTIVCSLVTVKPRGSTKNGESCSLTPNTHLELLLLGILFGVNITRITQLLSLLL